MIRLTDIAKSYPSKGGRKTVLSGINIDFPKGRNTAIIGPNGAGKSTLMRILSGAELPDRGTVKRNGSVSWPLGFAGGLHGSLTGRENVAFISRVYGRDFGEMLDFVQDFAEIGINMNNCVRTYSNGMKARVAFGMSMAIKFDYYLIDEVIGVGDAAFKKKCRQVMNNRLKDSTVILISHAPGTMRQFCDFGCVLHERNLISFQKIDDALNFYKSTI